MKVSSTFTDFLYFEWNVFSSFLEWKKWKGHVLDNEKTSFPEYNVCEKEK